MWEAAIPAALNFAGSLLGNKSSGAAKDARHIQMESWLLQRDMALNGVQRRVEDAQKAGVNPLVALGMNPYQGGVASVVGDTGGKQNTLGALADAGADVSRSLLNRGTVEERNAQKTLAALGVEKAGLENDLLRSQIRSMNAQVAPGMTASNDYTDIALKDARYPNQARMPMGYGDTAPFWREGKDAHGNTIRVYNDELGDNEALQAITAPASVYDMVANLGKRTGQWLTKPRFQRKWYHGKYAK